MPDRLKELVTKATGIDASNYDGAIINVYNSKTFISAHNDVDEAKDAINYPVLVVNIGGDGNFSIEHGKKPYMQKEYSQSTLQSGDAYIFGLNGENRDIYHRTNAGKIKGDLPALSIKNPKTNATYNKGDYRISITLRRVMPLTSGIPKVPMNINSNTTDSKQVENNSKPTGTINVYWGQKESDSSTRILSNLAPRRFKYESVDGVEREYGSVEHAYQTNKNGTFNENNYNAYVKIGGYGRKIAPRLTEKGKRGNLQLMKDLVVESFIQNADSKDAKKLLQYENFTHNTNEIIDKAFLEGLKLAQQELLNISKPNDDTSDFINNNKCND